VRWGVSAQTDFDDRVGQATPPLPFWS
jgi:hypothetical protein